MLWKTRQELGCFGPWAQERRPLGAPGRCHVHGGIQELHVLLLQASSSSTQGGLPELPVTRWPHDLLLI